MAAMLSIRDLRVAVEGKEILKGLSLSIKAGEVHAIMGPNGSGKSTLSYVLAGRAGYDITDGGRLISFDNGVDLPEVYGYDAAGVVNCTVSGMGTKTCTPLWSAVSGYNGSGFPASPAVVDGTLFINIPGAGAIYAYTGLPMLP